MNDPSQTVNRLIEGFRSTALIATAAKLNIFDHLTDAPASAQELAP